jgi:hypothetical protein
MSPCDCTGLGDWFPRPVLQETYRTRGNEIPDDITGAVDVLQHPPVDDIFHRKCIMGDCESQLSSIGRFEGEDDASLARSLLDELVFRLFGSSARDLPVFVDTIDEVTVVGCTSNRTAGGEQGQNAGWSSTGE